MTSPCMRTLFLSLLCFAYSCNAMDEEKQHSPEQQNAYELLHLYQNYTAQYRHCHWALKRHCCMNRRVVTIRTLQKCGIIIPCKADCIENRLKEYSYDIAPLTKLRPILKAQKRELETKIRSVYIQCKQRDITVIEKDKLITKIYKKQK